MPRPLPQHLFEKDLLLLKFLLKRRLVHMHVITKKEQQVMDTIMAALRSLRNIERFLVADTPRSMGKKHSFLSQRRALVIRLLKNLIHHFCQQIRNGNEIAEESVFLRERLDSLYSLCRKRALPRLHQNRFLRDFRASLVHHRKTHA